ncbi:EscU/YscU/HrcU family type III secretion system export apparatus switch protein [Pandoraea terrae]|uniref:EscU/YscU/HrcU family type III secretion system export apparatus switch protein n=1 Tax=Pandoraea terrae TaxID=1537710 RepID=A0A5E4ZF37_9BURK|nr:EscU/YscU/HrcU family type III secretion system export apparatus switch protein [Pandoraea terrae]VVE59142.1 EscU/YscU/HrcU family type III secretion system export apparatus switch protein [Pandoraea terrae]
MSEKNQKPTPKKIDDARKKGQVAKSADLTVFVQLGVLLAYFWLEGPAMFDAFRDLVALTLAVIGAPVDEAFRRLGVAALLVMARFSLGVAALLVFVTWMAMIMQFGVLVAPDAVAPKFERIDPVAKAKQLFSMQSLFEFGKSLTKVTVLSLIFFYLVRQYGPTLGALPQCGPACGFGVAVQMLFWLWAVLVLAYVVFGAADFAFQKFNHEKQLRMSLDEIKREYREIEGNPEMKHRRREQHREDVESGSLAGNVNKSTVVVRNPTRLAICLRFVPDETPVPVVVEKGRHARARAIVALAERAGIPVLEHVPVARRLMADVEIGAPIPHDLFEPVAAVLRLALNLPYVPEDAPES